MYYRRGQHYKITTFYAIRIAEVGIIVTIDIGEFHVITGVDVFG